MAIEGDPVVTRLSLYALISLARHVQRVRQLLKARVQAHKSPLLIDHHEQFVQRASIEGQSILKSLKQRADRLPSLPPVEKSAPEKTKIGFTILLHALDHHIKEANHRPLGETAADESLFVRHHVRYSHPTKLAEARHVFDLSTSLLARLDRMGAAGCGDGAKDYPCHQQQGWSLQDEKTVANLEHLLRCVQQDAWNALVQHFVRIIQEDRDHWGRYWQQIEQLDDGWFAEWPNGRRPLSTTWPWNIKPSLVILWGVCWMFVYGERDTYYDAGRGRGGGRPHQGNNAGARSHAPYGQALMAGYYTNDTTPAVEWQAAGELLADVSPAAAAASTRLSAAAAQVPTATATTTAAAAARPRLSECSPSPSRPHAHAPPAQMPMHFATQYQAENAASPLRYRPHVPLAASSSYNPNTTHISLACDSTLTDLLWNIPSSNVSPQAWFPSTENWQPVSEHSVPEPVDLPEKYLRRDQAPQLTLSTSYTPGIILGPQLEVSSYLEGELIAPMHGPDRNSSPYSENSDARHYPPGGPSPNSDQTHRASSMSVASPRSGVSPTQTRTEEPPRDAEGNMFCSHVKCSDQRKIFQRKCEWSKHMDKHERPHKCTVAGCEKLSGFTYAGGLLRHEREVHNMWGGPKASRMCPYADCKRSTGLGFTRKENLQEHLRRVHRGVEDRITKLEPEQAPSGGQGGSRKRRRVPLDEDPNKISDEDSEDTQETVKRLKQDVVTLQERVQQLENVVRTLLNGSTRWSS